MDKNSIFLVLELEYCVNGILVHLSNYTQKVLQCFDEDKAKPLSIPMIVYTLDVARDPFHPKEDKEEVLEPEIPYLSAFGALLYLVQCTGLDNSFVINLFARYSSTPTRCHWNGIKDIFCYLKGTSDMGLFYPHLRII